MAQVTIAQAPVPSWPIRFIEPAIGPLNIVPGSPMNHNYWFMPTGWIQAGSGPYNANVGAAGGSGVTAVMAFSNGNWCNHFGTTVAAMTQAIFFPWWTPLWGPVGSEDPGSINRPAGSVVAVLDYFLATNGQSDIGVGMILIPYSGAQSNTNFEPQGITPAGGFGIVGDGAGALQFVAFEGLSSGAVLQTVAIPAAVVPDFSIWNTYRFIIVTGNATNPATLSLEVNGTLIIDRQDFGTGILERPDQGLANAWTFCQHYTARVPSGPQMFARSSHKWGRFLPSGVAVQGE